MRIAYMDESGADPKDPLLVQAAILVHGDDQLVKLEAHLMELVRKHILKEHQDGFVFHAADISGGGGKQCIFRDEKKYPKDKRISILDDLIKIPSLFQVPLFVGAMKRQEYFNEHKDSKHSKFEKNVAVHALAIIQCELGVELWMRENAPNEIAHIIAEDNSDVRLAAREAHVLLKDRVKLEREGMIHPMCFPFERIRDGLQFATKAESSALQIADACAWAIRRACSGVWDGGRFYGPIKPMIANPSKATLAALSQLIS